MIFFMRMIFKDHQCVELLMKIIFGEQFSLKRFETQEDHKQVVSRSVELDIVVYTYEGAVIGIEVEKSKDNASPIRARYHASISCISFPNGVSSCIDAFK